MKLVLFKVAISLNAGIAACRELHENSLHNVDCISGTSIEEGEGDEHIKLEASQFCEQQHSLVELSFLPLYLHG